MAGRVITGATPLLVIVGETASGKSSVGMEIAEKYGGEIICADSRTVYRGMDIGTAKPSSRDRARVPHHCLDLVTPEDYFSAAEFKRHAQAAIDDITARGRLPVMVGGTGLYVDAVLYDFEFREPADPAERARLQNMTVEALQDELQARGIPVPENARNPRHLARALETGGASARHSALRSNTLLLGLRLEREVLERRITARIEQMVMDGFLEEVRQLYDSFGADAPALQAPGYKAFGEYIDGRIGLEEAKALFAKYDRSLAKRQRTWFKRNNSIQWFDDREELLVYVESSTTVLNK